MRAVSAGDRGAVQRSHPARWIAIYGTVLAVCAVVALRGFVPLVAPPLLMMVIALAWGVSTMGRVPAAGTYTQMFDEWEMKSASVEEAREASGLLIVAAWMAVIVVVQLRTGKS